jgi:hypothetical protein
MIGKMEAKSLGRILYLAYSSGGFHVYIMRAFPLLAILQSQPSSYHSTSTSSFVPFIRL